MCGGGETHSTVLDTATSFKGQFMLLYNYNVKLLSLCKHSTGSSASKETLLNLNLQDNACSHNTH